MAKLGVLLLLLCGFVFTLSALRTEKQVLSDDNEDTDTSLTLRNRVKRDAFGSEIGDAEYHPCIFGDRKCALRRRKRGIGSIAGKIFGAIPKIARVTGKVLKVTLAVGDKVMNVASLAYTIASIITNGCSVKKSICDDTKAIQTLEKECNELAAKLVTKYEGMGQDYDNMRDVYISNVEINNIIKGLSKEALSAFSTSEIVDAKINKRIDDSSLIGNTGLTAEEKLNLMVAPVTFNMNALRDLVKSNVDQSKQIVGIQIGVQLGVAAISSGIQGYIKQYNLVSTNNPSFTKTQKFTTAWSNAASKTKNFFKDFRKNVVLMKQDKMLNLKKTLSNKKGALKTYAKSLTLTTTFFNALGVAASAVSIWMTNKQWGAVADRLKTERTNLETYKSELQAQWTEAQGQTTNISDLYDETIGTYNEIVTSFSSELKNSLRDNSLYRSLSSDSQPANVADLLKTELATRANVKAKQSTTFQIVNDAKFEITKFRDWTTALNLIVTQALNGTDQNFPVSKIWENTELIFNYFPAGVKAHAKLVTLPSILCTIVNVEPISVSAYRTFPLTSLRSKCVDGIPTVADLTKWGYPAAHQALAVDFLIRESLADSDAANQSYVAPTTCQRAFVPFHPENINDLQSNITNAFTTDVLLQVSHAPTTYDVLCRIATIFPSRRTYDYVPLRDPFANPPLQVNDYCGLSDDDKLYRGWDGEDAKAISSSEQTTENRNICRRNRG